LKLKKLCKSVTALVVATAAAAAAATTDDDTDSKGQETSAQELN